MLLYLTSNQKSNLIDPAVRNMTLPAKKLVGRFSLKSFVTKDMRNYANAKFFVVDAACIEESGNDFTLALQSFQMMFSARIIVILSGCEDVNGEVQRLLSIGVVNLVTGETMEDALDELTEALSEDGMQRYVVKAPVYEQPVSRPAGTGDRCACPRGRALGRAAPSRRDCPSPAVSGRRSDSGRALYRSRHRCARRMHRGRARLARRPYAVACHARFR